ncbi:MAG: hypothetical protein LIO85_00045 [Rikenellaceae bacterium]|nr:hypothetical protein [Rikenellaceae bacterium]
MIRLYRIYLVIIIVTVCGCSDSEKQIPGAEIGDIITFTGNQDFITGISIRFEGPEAYFSTSGTMYIKSVGPVAGLASIDIDNIPDITGREASIRENYGYISVRQTGYHAYYISEVIYDADGNVESIRCRYCGFTPGLGWDIM